MSTTVVTLQRLHEVILGDISAMEIEMGHIQNEGARKPQPSSAGMGHAELIIAAPWRQVQPRMTA